jgi:hypothetical protein
MERYAILALFALGARAECAHLPVPNGGAETLAKREAEANAA